MWQFTPYNRQRMPCDGKSLHGLWPSELKSIDTLMFPFTACPQVFSSFLGVQSLTLHLGVQWKLTAFSPRKVVHHAVFFVNITQLAKTFFSVWHWVRQEVGFCLTHGLCVCPTIFFVILYIICQILFFIQNWMQDYLYIVMIIKQLN